MHFDPLSYYTANPFIPHVNKRVMIFSQLNNTSLTNILDDITFGKPNKTKYIVKITQISQFYGIFSPHQSSMIHIIDYVIYLNSFLKKMHPDPIFHYTANLYFPHVYKRVRTTSK